jgi:hypothetical protein
MQSIRFMRVMLVLTVVLATGATCWGAPALVLAGRGNGLYEVVAQGLEDVRDINLTITYNPSTLTEPRIKQRGLVFGAMMTPDFSSPGLIRVSITSSNPQGLKGSGSIAMVSFNMASREGGQITSFTANLTSAKGEEIPLPKPQILADEKGRFLGDPFLRNTVEPAGPITGTLGTVAEPPAAPLPLTVASGGTVAPLNGASSLSPAPEQPGFVELPMVDGETASAVVPDQGGGDLASQPKRPEVTPPGVRSVLSLFKAYTGPEFTIQRLIALFSQAAIPGLRQDPPVALADGTTKVVVHITPQSASAQSPNFALTGAKQLSLKRSGAEYILELIPDAGLYESSVTLMNKGRVTEYQLVVAPPMSPGLIPGGKIDATTFALYLKGYAEGRGDTNNDGNVDYLDLYLYTVNYLVRNKGAGAVLAPSRVPAPAVHTPFTSKIPK